MVWHALLGGLLDVVHASCGSITLRVQGPNNRVSGPKYYKIKTMSALKSYNLGPWTLRVKF